MDISVVVLFIPAQCSRIQPVNLLENTDTVDENGTNRCVKMFHELEDRYNLMINSLQSFVIYILQYVINVVISSKEFVLTKTPVIRDIRTSWKVFIEQECQSSSWRHFSHFIPVPVCP